MSSQTHLSEEANIADLVAMMLPEDREIYESFGHLRVDPGFVNRIYVVYKPTGLTSDGAHREPDILGQVKIVDWYSDMDNGTRIVFEDMRSGECKTVGHTPMRLFDYDIFVSAPPYQRIRYEARKVGEGVQRSALFSVLIKTRVRSNFYSRGVTFCESPKCFKELYPNLITPIQFI